MWKWFTGLSILFSDKSLWFDDQSQGQGSADIVFQIIQANLQTIWFDEKELDGYLDSSK